MKKLFIFIFLCLTLACLAASCGAVHKHEFGGWIPTKEASCLKKGEQERYCYCLEKETEILPALGHRPTDAAACAEDQRCTVCNTVLRIRGEHEFGAFSVTQNASCTEKGAKERVCLQCGEKEIRTIYPTGHAYGDWTVVKEATATEAGSEERICFCGKKQTKTIAPHEP